MNFGERIQERMLELDLSTIELSRRLKIDAPRLRYYLNSKREPDYEMLVQICAALRTSPDWILGVAEDQRSIASEPDFLPIPEDHTAIRFAIVRPGMGGPADAFGDEKQISFFKSSIIKRIGTEPANLWAMEVRGNSMDPVLQSHDLVIVDETQRDPSQPDIFVLWDGLGMVCKHVERIVGTDPPRVMVRSYNPLVAPYELTIGEPGVSEAYIMGRVVWYSREL